MATKKNKNIKFRVKNGKWEAYDSVTGKSLGYVEDMSNASKPKKTKIKKG